MKKLALLLLALVCNAALAAGVDTMVAQCENVMACGLCRVETDQRVYAPGATKIFTLRDGTTWRIPAKDYDWIREPQDAKDPKGGYLMCNRVRAAMKKPDSNHGRAARALFDDRWDGRSYCPAVK